MRRRHLARMYSCSNDKTLLLRCKFFRLVFVHKQILILEFFIFVEDILLGGNGKKFNRPAFNCSDNIWSLEVEVWLSFTFFLYLVEKGFIVSVWPGIEEGEENFLVGSHCMPKRPLDPTFIEFLSKSGFTIRSTSTLCAIRFQSLLSSSR